MAFNPDHSGLLAAGSYTALIGLYTQEEGIVSILEGHTGGITQVGNAIYIYRNSFLFEVTNVAQVQFTPDGNYLFSGARKENTILCWDIRNTSRVVMRLTRLVENNQHIHFDIDPTGRYLVTASQVWIWDCVTMLNMGSMVLQ